MATILLPRSGIGYSAVLGRLAFLRHKQACEAHIHLYGSDRRAFICIVCPALTSGTPYIRL